VSFSVIASWDNSLMSLMAAIRSAAVQFAWAPPRATSWYPLSKAIPTSSRTMPCTSHPAASRASVIARGWKKDLMARSGSLFTSSPPPLGVGTISLMLVLPSERVRKPVAPPEL